jgi:hypothetical protein
MGVGRAFLPFKRSARTVRIASSRSNASGTALIASLVLAAVDIRNSSARAAIVPEDLSCAIDAGARR